MNFKNINFWFKKNIIKELSKIRKFIFSISNKPVRDLFLVTFSETVRKVSNQKKEEFKLVKMKPEQLKEQNPNVLNVFQFLDKNIQAILELRDHLLGKGRWPPKDKDIQIYMHDSTKKEFSVKKNSALCGVAIYLISQDVRYFYEISAKFWETQVGSFFLKSQLGRLTLLLGLTQGLGAIEELPYTAYFFLFFICVFKVYHLALTATPNLF